MVTKISNQICNFKSPTGINQKRQFTNLKKQTGRPVCFLRFEFWNFLPNKAGILEIRY